MAIFAVMNLWEISEARRQAALQVIRESGVVEAWESVGATVNLVGSVRTGLVMKNLDVDFHIYTDEPMMDKSIAAIGKLEQNPEFGDVLFKNFLDTEEECLEWHAWYTDTTGEIWKFDMIHIRRGSAFDGAIERTTDAIIARLTPDTRKAILRIKHDAPAGVKTLGIEVYYAVLELGLRTYDEFAAWKLANRNINLLGWRP
jgi:hypothetical protein